MNSCCCFVSEARIAGRFPGAPLAATTCRVGRDWRLAAGEHSIHLGAVARIIRAGVHPQDAPAGVTPVLVEAWSSSRHGASESFTGPQRAR
jgi:hypothetical protein